MYSCSKCNTLGSLTAPVTDIATHCSADRPVGRPQRIPHRCTPLRGTGSQPQEFCRGFCLVRALSQLSWLEPSHSSGLVIDIATHCSADRPVGCPQRIPHRCTPLRGTGSQPQEFCRDFCLVRALSQLSRLEPSHSSRPI